MLGNILFFLVGVLVLIMVVTTLLIWPAVLWRYFKAGQFLQGMLQIGKTLVMCIIIALATFAGFELLSSYLGGVGEGSDRFNLVDILATVISVLICPFVFLLRGLDAYEEAGELLEVEASVEKSWEILDD